MDCGSLESGDIYVTIGNGDLRGYRNWERVEVLTEERSRLKVCEIGKRKCGEILKLWVEIPLN